MGSEMCIRDRCGIPIDSPVDVFCDNQSVTKNATLPQSALNKRHNTICCHMVREAQASAKIRVGWIQGEHNQADLGPKTTLSTKRRHELVNEIMWNDGFTSVDTAQVSSSKVPLACALRHTQKASRLGRKGDYNGMFKSDSH